MIQREENVNEVTSISEYLVEEARYDLLSYIRLTHRAYKPNWHHEVIVDHLEQVAFGLIKRLIILVPPRYGKSEIASIRFPAWYLGQNPDKKVKEWLFNEFCKSSFLLSNFRSSYELIAGKVTKEEKKEEENFSDLSEPTSSESMKGSKSASRAKKDDTQETLSAEG